MKEKTYRMGELIPLLGLNKGQIRNWIDQYRAFIEIHGEKHLTRYPESTLDTLKLILKLDSQGKSVKGIKNVLENMKEVELTPRPQTLETVLETVLKTGQLRIAIDVNIDANIRLVRD